MKACEEEQEKKKKKKGGVRMINEEENRNNNNNKKKLAETQETLVFHEPICESMAICVLYSALI